jgi:RNA polymerase sigma-70 factor, ECF subfamily
MIDVTQAENLSDEEVVKLILENQDYFLLIINRYQSKLHKFIMRLTNIDPEDAEDLLQEIFLKIYLNLNDFDQELKFSSWAYSIARNQVISNHRKLQVRAEGHSSSLDDESVEKLMSDIDIQKNIDAKLQKKKIMKVLDGLDEKYREVLVLKYLEEKNYKEISDIIKKRIGTVSSTINRAKELFKKELSKQDIKF